MSEKRQIKLEMQVDNEDCDVVTKVTDTAVTDALGYTPMNSSDRGATNGVASLTSGKVPANELPSYVDDVIEGYYYNSNFYSDSAHKQLITGEAGKIYVDLSTNSSYRFTGTTYIEISQPITIDSAMSTTSTNPVQNKVIKAALDDKVNAGAADSNGQSQLYKTVDGVTTNVDPVCSLAAESTLATTLKTATIVVSTTVTSEEGWYQLAEWDISDVPSTYYFGYNILFVINGSKSYTTYGNATLKAICYGAKKNVGDATKFANRLHLMSSSRVSGAELAFTESMFKLTFKMDSATKNITYKLWWHKDPTQLTHSERFSISLIVANDSDHGFNRNIAYKIHLKDYPDINYQIGATGYLENDPEVLAVDCAVADVYNTAMKANQLKLNAASADSNTDRPILCAPAINPDTTLVQDVYKASDLTFNASKDELKTGMFKGGINTLVDHEAHSNINRWRKICEFSTNGHSNASGQCALSLTILVTDGKYTSIKKGDALLRIITHKEVSSGALSNIINNFTMDFSTGTVSNNVLSYKDPSAFKLTYTTNGTDITYKLWYYVDKSYLATNFILLAADSAYDTKCIVSEVDLSMGTLSTDYMNDDGVAATGVVDCVLGVIANDIEGNAKTATHATSADSATSSTNVQQTYVSANKNRPLLLSDTGNTTTTTGINSITTYSNKFYANPSTGQVTIPQVNGTLNGKAKSLNSTYVYIHHIHTEEGWQKVAEWTNASVSNFYSFAITLLVSGGRANIAYGDNLLKIFCYGNKTSTDVTNIVNTLSNILSIRTSKVTTFIPSSSFVMTYTKNGKDITYKLWLHRTSANSGKNETYAFTILNAVDTEKGTDFINDINLLSNGTFSTGAKGYMTDGTVASTASVTCGTGTIGNGTTGNAASATSSTETRQTLTTSNNDRPLLLSSSTNTSDTTANVTGTVQRTNNIYANASTGALTATSFVGNLTGTASEATHATSADAATNATNATNAQQTLTTSNNNRPLLLSSSTSVSDTTANVTGTVQRTNKIYGNASTGALTATSFVGGLTGASTETRQALTTTNHNRPLLISSSTNTSDTTTNINGTVQRTNKIYANASTGTLTATSFVGNLTGTASEATHATSADAATDATNATKATQTLTTSNNNRPLLLSSSTSVSDTTANVTGTVQRTNKIYGNASTGALTATSFVGPSTQTRQALTSSNNNRPLLLSSSTNTSDTATNINGTVQRTNNIYANASTGEITATSFVGNLTGTASEATHATSADAANSAISSTETRQMLTTSNDNRPLLLSSSASVSDTTTYINGTVQRTNKIYANASTGTLTATKFSGSGASLTNLNASKLASGTVPIARIPTGTSSTTVALGNHTHNDYLPSAGGTLVASGSSMLDTGGETVTITISNLSNYSLLVAQIQCGTGNTSYPSSILLTALPVKTMTGGTTIEVGPFIGEANVSVDHGGVSVDSVKNLKYMDAGISGNNLLFKTYDTQKTIAYKIWAVS